VQAAADARAIVEDAAAFSWPVTVTNPSGLSAVLNGLTKDIAAHVDPETGIVVSSRTASVTLSTASLETAGLGVPKNIPQKTSKPWVIQFFDVAGMLHAFKVIDSLPDTTLGLVVCRLEVFKVA
jgi:hypothetical protein